MGRKSNPVLAEEARSHIKKKVVVVGKAYLITGGTYKGRLVKINHIWDNPSFAVVNFLDAFGKMTAMMDVVPVKYLE